MTSRIFFSHQILVVLAKQQQRWWGIEMVEAPPFPNWYKNPPTGPNSLSVDPERSFSSAHLCKHEGLCKYIYCILAFLRETDVFNIAYWARRFHVKTSIYLFLFIFPYKFQILALTFLHKYLYKNIYLRLFI